MEQLLLKISEAGLPVSFSRFRKAGSCFPGCLKPSRKAQNPQSSALRIHSFWTTAKIILK